MEKAFSGLPLDLDAFVFVSGRNDGRLSLVNDYGATDYFFALQARGWRTLH